jgi:beta-lactamase class A
MATLLRLVCRDGAGPARVCAARVCAPVRHLLAGLVTQHRLRVGFPTDVKVAAKTGSLMGAVRNEVGVVSYPDDGRTRSRSSPGSTVPGRTITRSTSRSEPPRPTPYGNCVVDLALP